MISYREKLKEKFNEEYLRLNTYQRKAVDTIEGPVMVIAGPGTGKTQILAARIGKILLETDVSPNNILCLTYTEAGAIAMRRRLVEFIGSDAYKVAIHTFHAFCNEVIQDNLSLFEKDTLDPISELESIQLFRDLIDGLPKSHPLKRYRGEVYYEARHLRSLFSSMKKEGWTTEFLNRCIDEHITSLPTRDEFICKRASKGFKKGDVRTDWLEAEVEKFERLRAAVNEFDRFSKMMLDRKRYDFDDMINWVIAAFEENKNLLSNYQEQYQYILVDEYQDTSGTQNQLVSLLINYWDKPNIFVVGDDDQSIFRFQGANVENMLDFQGSFQNDLVTVVLTHNYRSSQPILDVSKELINRNEERLIKKIDGLSKDLIASGDNVKDIKTAPVIKEYHSARDEMAGLTESIESLIKENVPPGNIAVIYSKHKYGLELARYLSLKKIPVYTKRYVNLLEDPFAKKILTILRYLSEEHDIPYSGDENLFKIMHFDFYKIPPIEIAKLSVYASNRDANTSFRKALVDNAAAPAVDLFAKGPDKHLVEFSSMMEKLISYVANMPLQQLFEKVIVEAGALPYVMNSEMRHYLMQVLTSLFDFIKEETARNPDLDIHSLMEMIELMAKEKISLPLVQVSGSDKGVNLMTAHGAKGLEFDYVFLVGAVSKLWEKHKDPAGGYKLPENIFSSAESHSETEELRRLFYVALTRAKKSLTITYSRFDNAGKEFEPSMFVAELRERENISFETVPVNEENRFAFELLQFTPLAPEIERSEEDFIAPLLEKFTMNVTALNSYLDCPLGFYYKNLLRIPSGKNEALVFGSAAHYALEQLFRKMLLSKEKTGKETFPSKEEMIMDFKKYMDKHRENFTRQAYLRKLEHGDAILPGYYDKYINSWNKIVLVELNVRGVLMNGIPLKGKLDKLEFNNKEVNVVDYKTGLPENAKEKLNPPSDKDPNGGDYWRQAVFYKLLIDNYKNKDWRVVSTEFDFVEPDKTKHFRKEIIPIKDADIETVKQQIQSVWNKIHARDFYTGCGKEKCTWCNFVKDNNIAVSLHEIQEEEA